MVNPYQCPDSIYEVMQTADKLATKDTISLLNAVVKLGPIRARWLGPTPQKHQSIGCGNNLSCWALDHKRVTHNELLIAAGLESFIFYDFLDLPSKAK